MSPLVSGEMLGLSVNTLTSDGKYPVQGCENLKRPSQMRLSEKPKTFSQLLFPFLESTSNFKHFKRDMIFIASVFPKLQTMKILVRPLSKKRRFKTRFDSQQCESVPNACKISMKALLSCFFVILRELDLENLSHSFRCNLIGVC